MPVPKLFIRNSFHVLGATPRDSRRRIVELAEERALTDATDGIAKARSELTHPRARLAAEIAWLPGVSPKRAMECLALTSEGPARIFETSALPPLSRANLMAAALGSVDVNEAGHPWATWLTGFATTVEEINPDIVQQHVNEDRTVAGFPEISTRDWVEAEISNRRKLFKTVVHDWLDRLAAKDLLAVVTTAVESSTNLGAEHPPRLIEEITEDFELSAKPAFGKVEASIAQLLDRAKSLAPMGQSALAPIIDQIERFAKEWRRLVRPVQLCAKSQGEEHPASQQLAYKIRGLAIDLANEYQLLEVADRLTQILRDEFSEVPDVAEKISEDATALQNLKKSAADREAFEREITYSADIGLLTRKRLAISPQDVQWGKQRFALKEITRIRWGGVQHRIGTDYHLVFGTSSDLALAHTNRESIYTAFTQRLWRATCAQIMLVYANGLKAGKTYRFGDIIVADDGCEVVRHKFIGVERIKAPWSNLQIWSASGNFVVGVKDDKKTYASASYKDVDNVHALEQMIRIFFKDNKARRLSDGLLN